MIIDAHSHAIGEFADPEQLFQIMKDLVVDKVVLCPGAGDPHGDPFRPKVKESILTTNPNILFLSNKYLRRKSKNFGNRETGNEFVQSLVNKYPERLIHYYWVNFKTENHFEQLQEHYKTWSIKGLKLHQCVVPFQNDSEELENLSRFAAEKNLPIFIHVFNKKEAKKLITTMRDNPDTNYTIAHMMGLEEVIKWGNELTNVYFDTSTYYIISKRRILKAIKYFGADHVIMGSDSPLGHDNLENIMKKIRSMDISSEDRELIMGGNIARLLRL